ncbi:MAG: 4Fe-4S binding protein [Clostridia bacterium]|nr:4Fe-4S binding protein [Clostridia bacterium]
MKKIKAFFEKYRPTKRKWMQLYFALLFNANIKGFITGNIYKGTTKSVCVPGINCYSCPGAVGACPMGSLQNAMNGKNHGSIYYVGGILVLYSILFGRMICGWLCPFGWIQELLHKIKTPKIKKGPVTRILSFVKYVILVVFVFIIPFLYAIRDVTLPAFCKYICPAGTVEGGMTLLSYKINESHLADLGPLFTWKFLLMVSILVGCVFVFRLFCRFLCPLGALYGLFNRFSIFGIKLDRSKCVDCNKCIAHCEMDIRHVGDPECISCGECVSVCPTNAIRWKGPQILLPKNEVGADPDSGKPPVSKKKWIVRVVALVAMLAVLGGTMAYHWNITTQQEEILKQQEENLNQDNPDGQPRGNAVGDLCYGYDLPIITADGIQTETLDPTTLGKVTVINFWYTTCGPCVAELPDFDAVAKKYADQIAVVAVHGLGIDQAPGFITEYYSDSPIVFLGDFVPAGFDPASPLYEMNRSGYYTMLGGSNTAYPRTVIVDETGVITHIFPGPVSHADLEAAVKDALQ